MCNYNDRCGKLCPRFAVTTAVTFAADTLTLTLPDTITYSDGCKYCIVIGQTIPDTTTLFAEVVVTVGDGTTTFPLLTCEGAPVVASQLATRTRYPVRVATTAAGGSLTVLRKLPCTDVNSLASLNGA